MNLPRHRGRWQTHETVSPLRLWVALVAAVLFAGMALAPRPVAGLSDEQRDRGILGSVKVYNLTAKGQLDGGCSGTVVDPAGYVLTNFHCVGWTPRAPERIKKNGVVGGFYHPPGIALIATLDDSRRLPKPAYVGRVVTGSPQQDVALIKLTGLPNTKAKLPAHLPLVIMPLGDSEHVQIGDPLYAVGYPTAGGETLTVTQGIISGYTDLTPDGDPDAWKTTALISPGNSGGLSMNDRGEQIGINTVVFSEDEAFNLQLGGVQMINYAVPFIEEALALAGGAVGVLPDGFSPMISRPLPPRPPTQRLPAVVVAGSVIDADTKRPIPNAAITVLQPGVSVAGWEQGAGGEAATGLTEGDGRYQSSPAVSPGQSYTVVVTAKGYQRRSVEITLGAEERGLVQVRAVELKKR